MKRVLAVAVLVSGCASGSTPGATDGSVVHDAPAIDAPIIDAAHIDAPVIDAPHIDAPHIDAPAIDAPHIDAPIDAARQVDAAPPDACVPQNTQLLKNPTFDLTPAGTSWTETSPAGFELVGAYVTPEQSAPFNAWLGGETGFGVVTDFLTQDVVVPAGTTKLELTGYTAVLTTETGSIAFDTADLAVTLTDGTPVEDVVSLSNLTTPVGAWTPFDHVFTNPAALAGKTIRVRMTSTVDDTNESDFFFDTFALTATHCP